MALTHEEKLEHDRIYREAHREEINAYNKAHRADKAAYDRAQRIANPGKRQAYLAEYYQAHKEESRKSTAQWRLNNPEGRKEHSRKYSQKHKVRLHEKCREWRAANPERVLELDLKYRLENHGMTIGDYEKLLLAQDGRCAICGVDVCELSERLCIDHNHDTGRVRGLLCRQCNWILGRTRKDPDMLSASAAYLERYGRDV